VVGEPDTNLLAERALLGRVGWLEVHGTLPGARRGRA
jgi:hypothetical protein